MFKKLRAFEASSIFEFKDPDTGHIYRAPKLTILYKDIIQYRVQNNLEMLENLKEVVENYLCSLPENCNKCDGIELDRTLFMYVKGGIQLLKNAFFKKHVTQDVAETRSEQCIKCKYNVFPDREQYAAWADNIAVMQVGEKKVSKHEELGHCEVCTCSLRSKVFFDGTLLKFEESQVEKMKTVNCWQLKLSGQ